ncbi:MAG TPA: GNAT family N-acetyltransferase, partial [Ktedonobacterales bacterium]|nr:GNAT family N-acetyltransferase [Ktedonobacterales bacterium]
HYTMNVRGARLKARGIGMVAVDLAHKKEHVARDLVRFFVESCRADDAPFALLYPFRPDFYKQMGFGYGTKQNQYHVVPSALPATGHRDRAAFLTPDDKDAVCACFNRYAAQTHGMIDKSQTEAARFFENPEMRLVGYRGEQGIEGYLAFTFRTLHTDNPMQLELIAQELVYENRAALLGMLAFLRSQFDQVHRIQFDTQDEDFHYLLDDPRDTSNNLLPSVYHQSNAQGVGLMYRVVNTRRVFEQLRDANFGDQDLTLRLTVRDSFLPENDGSVLVRFREGKPQVLETGKPDVDVSMEVAECSALLMGCVSFTSLHTFGLADISDLGSIERVDRLFAVPKKPICLTAF